MALRADDVDLGRDRALVERYQAGDHSAFDDLYRRYFERLRRYCVRRVHDPHTAEEIAQEAFVRALHALPRFAGDRRFYPWMTVIASRLCVDHHRRAQRTEPADVIDLGAVDADTAHLDDEVDLAHLAIAMDRLAPRHREILELRERDGLSYQEISDRLDVTFGTVEALLHRARRALRREFRSVSGDATLGRLAGVPLLGALIRNAHRLRDRVAEIEGLARPLAIGAASVALAAAPFAVRGALPSGDQPASPPAAQTAPSRVIATHLPSGAETDVAATPAPASTSPAVAASAPVATAAPPRVLAPGTRVYSGGDDRARAAAAEQPFVGDVGPTTIGVDPVELVVESAEELLQLMKETK